MTKNYHGVYRSESKENPIVVLTLDLSECRTKHPTDKTPHIQGGFVLILKSAWGVLSTLYYWAWGVLSAFKKTCGGFCPPITKWTWGVMSVGCFVRIPI